MEMVSKYLPLPILPLVYASTFPVSEEGEAGLLLEVLFIQNRTGVYTGV